MQQKTAHDFDQDLLILFDAYVHGALDRRGFLEQASRYAVGGVTAARYNAEAAKLAWQRTIAFFNKNVR